MEFGTRGGFTNDEGGVKIGNLFYGTKGWLWIEEAGQEVAVVLRAEERKGARRRHVATPTPSRRASRRPNLPHYQNFIDAIRANDPKVLACDVFEGHMSSSLPHLGNISYRVGRALTFDGKAEKFVDDKQADRLLTREYRKGFEVTRG